jgi:hypothetical protein
MLGLTEKELRTLKRLTTPIKIQDYLDTIPMNFEKKGDTHYSPREVLKRKTAHCIEGALVAAAALWVNGEEPWIMDMIAEKGDDDHVIALYKKNGAWGAISKTNHATIRFRDPVYRTPRELALSYFHEWFRNFDGRKTLRSYSSPFNLKKLGSQWVTADDVWFVGRALDRVPHHQVVPAGNLRYIRTADPMELKAGKLIEWKENT